MKKFIAIFLLLQIVSNNTIAGELVKLPKLFTHFFHHTREHKDVQNFAEYLHKHYADNHKHEHSSPDQDDEDSQLPFKNDNNCCVNLHFPSVTFVSSDFSADFSSYEIDASDFNSEDDRIESLSCGSIWQPPKLA